MGSFSFEGWDISKFIRGRKKLIIAAIGYIAGQIATQRPDYAAICAAGAELTYAVIEYWIKSDAD